MTKKKKKPGRQLRRCLGESQHEHEFWSEGPWNRVCGVCRNRLELRTKGVSRQHFEPFCVGRAN